MMKPSTGICFSQLRIATLVLAAAAVSAGNPDKEFLVANAEREGVVSLSSGLQYQVISSGPADGARPSANTKCSCHYIGTTIDGTVFDSSRKRGSPSSFKPNQVVKGWTEALQLMRPGDRWMLYFPSELGYGARGSGGKIPGGATLIFDLELIELVLPTLGVFHALGLPMAERMDEPFFSVLPIPTWLVVVVVAIMIFFGSAVSSLASDGGTVSAAHILVKREDKAVELKAELDAVNGVANVADKFAVLARAHSTCPSGQNGGSLGTFGPGQMVPAFDSVCWSAPVGVVQGPVTTQFGSHLILVTDRTVRIPDKEDKKTE